MRENRTSGSEGREKGNQPFFLTSINTHSLPSKWDADRFRWLDPYSCRYP